MRGDELKYQMPVWEAADVSAITLKSYSAIKLLADVLVFVSYKTCWDDAACLQKWFAKQKSVHEEERGD